MTDLAKQEFALPYNTTDAWEEWLARKVEAKQYSAHTMKSYTKGVRMFYQGARLTIPTPADVLDWQARMISEGRSVGTVNAWLCGLKSLFRWVAECGRLPLDPLAGVKTASRKGANSRHKRDPLTDEEVRRVLALPDTTDVGRRDRAMLYLFAFTGLREGEAQAADIADLKTEQGRLVLMVLGKGRVEKDELVVIPQPAIGPLMDWIAERGQDPGPLFVSLSNRNLKGRLTTRMIRKIVKRYMRLAGVVGIERKTTHSLRHTAVTNAILHGATPLQVKGMTRHANLETVMIYYHDVERLRDPAEDSIDYGE
jgi:integrase/recombinase XerD